MGYGSEMSGMGAKPIELLLKDKDARIAELHKKLERVCTERTWAEEERDTLKARVEELERQDEKQHKALNAINAERLAESKECQELRTRVEEMTKLYRDADEELGALSVERDELKARDTEARTIISGLRNRLKIVSWVKKLAEAANFDLQAQLSKYESPKGAATACPYAIIDTLKAELKLSQTDRDEMVDEVARLEQQLAAANEKLAAQAPSAPTIVKRFTVRTFEDFTDCVIYSDGTVKATLESVGEK